jgi:hypothetical protein
MSWKNGEEVTKVVISILAVDKISDYVNNLYTNALIAFFNQIILIRRLEIYYDLLTNIFSLKNFSGLKYYQSKHPFGEIDKIEELIDFSGVKATAVDVAFDSRSCNKVTGEDEDYAPKIRFKTLTDDIIEDCDEKYFSDGVNSNLPTVAKPLRIFSNKFKFVCESSSSSTSFKAWGYSAAFKPLFDSLKTLRTDLFSILGTVNAVRFLVALITTFRCNFVGLALLGLFFCFDIGSSN